MVRLMIQLFLLRLLSFQLTKVRYKTDTVTKTNRDTAMTANKSFVCRDRIEVKRSDVN